MTKPVFRRGLDEPFIDALNSEYGKSGWWKRIVDDKDLFIAIRNGYLNVYFNGGSVLELRHAGGELVGKTHFKHLLNLATESNDDYIRFSGGKFSPVEIGKSYRDIASDIEGIKKSIKLYQGDEKAGVHHIILDNCNVIDTEIAIPGENARIDFAALQRCKGRMNIVFFEAKTYSSPDIRSQNRPAVLEQICRYNTMICGRREELEEAYRQVLRNVLCLEGWRDRRHPVLSEAAACDLHVDPKIRLVIFGFDAPQRRAAEDGSNGAFRRLRHCLGEDRVLTRGDPKGLRRGIESPEQVT